MPRSILFAALLGAMIIAGLFIWMNPEHAGGMPGFPVPPPTTESSTDFDAVGSTPVQSEPAEVADKGLVPASAAAPGMVVDTDAVERLFEREVEGDRRTGGAETLRVNQGEPVRILVRADQADELHLHGYDLKVALKPGTTAQMTFKAVHSGRFELELHSGHQTLAALEVMPK